LDRLGRSARDLHDIAAELAGKGIKLSIGGSIHDPGDPIGKMLRERWAAQLLARSGRRVNSSLDRRRDRPVVRGLLPRQPAG